MYSHLLPLNMPKKPAPKDWHRADIIAAVRKTGTNLQKLSRVNDLGRTTLNKALHGSCPKYERIIAEHLGLHPKTIWPSRYHEDGTSKRRGERGIKKETNEYYIQNDTVLNDTPIAQPCNVYGPYRAGKKVSA
jgi:Ner family transcriptional regulator